MERERWKTIGETLKKAREALGLGLELLSQKIDVPLWKLRLIEEGQFDRVDAPFYVRYYIKLYAQEVGLDASQLVGTEDFSKEETKIASKSKKTLLAETLNVLMLAIFSVALIFFVYSVIRFFGVLHEPSVKLVNTSGQVILLDGKPVAPGETVLLKTGSKYEIKNNKGGCTIISANKRWVVRVENFEVVLWER